MGDFYELLSDPIKSMKIEIVNSFYKKSYYTQYDTDVFHIQMLIVLLVPCGKLSFFFSTTSRSSNCSRFSRRDSRRST